MTVAIVARTARDALETARNMMLTRPGSWIYVDREEHLRGVRVETVVWVEGWTYSATKLSTMRMLELRRTPTCHDLDMPRPGRIEWALDLARQAAADLEAQRSWGKPPASPFVSPEAAAEVATRPRRRRSFIDWLWGER